VDRGRYPNVVFATCAVAAGEPVFTIDPLGNLRPCTHSPLILGNVRTTDPERLRGGELERLYEGVLHASCTACEHLPDCGGGCRASSDACFGRPDVESPLTAHLRARSTGCAFP
jgi:radical SAM protein with 4Fe4S-binding SPASM domain